METYLWSTLIFIISKKVRSNYLICIKFFKGRGKQWCSLWNFSTHFPFVHVLLARNHLYFPLPSQAKRIFDANWILTHTSMEGRGGHNTKHLVIHYPACSTSFVHQTCKSAKNALITASPRYFFLFISPVCTVVVSCCSLQHSSKRHQQFTWEFLGYRYLGFPFFWKSVLFHCQMLPFWYIQNILANYFDPAFRHSVS